MEAKERSRNDGESRWPKRLVGLALLPLFWLLFALFSFGPFDRETPAIRILSVTGAVFVAIVSLLYRLGLIDLRSGLLAVPVFGAMVGFYSIPIRGELHSEAAALNRARSEAHDDRYEYARAVFHDVRDRFTSPTREYLLQPQKIFLLKSFAYFWETEGYVPSHLQAQMYRKMLIASGRFGPEEVEYRTGRCFNSPHGYVVIHHPERVIHADLWAAQNFDDYRFGQLVEMPSCDTLSAKGPEGEPYRGGETRDASP